MGVFDFLFGGAQQKSVTTPKDLTPPEFTGLRPEIAAFLKNFMETGGPGFSGQLSAPVTGPQQGLIDTAVRNAASAPPEIQAAMEQLQKTMGGNYLPGQAGQNPFIDAIVSQAQGDLQRNFEDSIVPQLLSRFTQSGQEVQGTGSSAFAREARLAGSEQQRQLSGVESQIRGGAYEAERARQAAAPGAVTALSTENLNRMTTGLQAAALPQLVADLGIERGLAEFNRRMQALLSVLQVAGSLAAPTPVASQVSRQSQSPGLIPSIFPGTLAALGAGG